VKLKRLSDCSYNPALAVRELAGEIARSGAADGKLWLRHDGTPSLVLREFLPPGDHDKRQDPERRVRSRFRRSRARAPQLIEEGRPREKQPEIDRSTAIAAIVVKGPSQAPARSAPLRAER
jgi:hypothetical protein